MIVIVHSRLSGTGSELPRSSLPGRPEQLLIKISLYFKRSHQIISNRQQTTFVPFSTVYRGMEEYMASLIVKLSIGLQPSLQKTG
jgi:hypothetical protein